MLPAVTITVKNKINVNEAECCLTMTDSNIIALTVILKQVGLLAN
jgi:hypothetical protein